MKKFTLSPAHDKRLISQLMSSRRCPNTTDNENFTLKGSNDFISRSNNVFGELVSLEEVHKTWVSKNDTHESFGQDEQSETYCSQQHATSAIKKLTSNKPNKDYHDIKSSFKKPRVPHLYFRKNASKKKMQKWRKYSLADVPLSSDAANAATALSFINELRKRKAAEKEKQEADDGKIVFSKPKPKNCYSETFGSFKTSCKTPLSHDTTIKNVNDRHNPVTKIKLEHLEEELE